MVRIIAAVSVAAGLTAAVPAQAAMNCVGQLSSTAKAQRAAISAEWQAIGEAEGFAPGHMAHMLATHFAPDECPEGAPE